jgi:hypothetical protein
MGFEPTEPTTRAVADSAAAEPTRAISLPAPPRTIETPWVPNETTQGPPRRRRVSRGAPFIVGSLALIVLVGTVLALGGPLRDQAVAALTDAPSPTPGAVVVLPSSSNEPTQGSLETPLPPVVTPTGATEPTATPDATPKRTPRPDPTPNPTPPPTPKPDPTPDQTPAQCDVVDLVGVRTNQAQLRWTEAGFTGVVVFDPQPPKHYIIESQSLTPGESVACTRDITVQGTP